MPDPFEALRLPLTPAEPDPAFARDLRARVERALDLPKGTTVSNLVIESPTFSGQRAAITPYLAVAGARAAIDWYVEAFGARLTGDPVVMPDGRVGHSELEIGGARLYLSDEHPEIGVSAPPPGQASVSLYLEVAGADEVVAQAVEAGARTERAVGDYPYGRVGVVRDPFGHRWIVRSERVVEARHRGQAAALRHGDIGYASLWVADADRAAAFFSQVLGWSAVPSGTGYQVEGRRPHHGIVPVQGRPTLFLAFAVRDIAEAARNVREAGGEAGEATAEPYGLASMCTDNQGARFTVYQPSEGVVRNAATRARGRPGDLSYVTMEVPDSERARSFYGSVLGWHFSPGSVPGGWRVEGLEPMVGLSGRHSESTNVPVYQTGDIAATVAMVREAGGTSSGPEARPYGLSADCTDDQGVRFGLWQP
ncbi:MAG: VOC family protein [Actinomycetota bacterium]|nr:VOC family protein [Actinomycetota bacterium]